jgi:protein ImuA
LRPAGADVLALRVLKRRGPPLESPLHIALPPVLGGAALRRAQEGQRSAAMQPVALRAAAFVNLA